LWISCGSHDIDIAFVLINIYKRRTLLKKLGIYNDSNAKKYKRFFKSFFHLPTSSMYGSYTQIKYYCISYGNEHKGKACPKCGSKMKRVGQYSIYISSYSVTKPYIHSTKAKSSTILLFEDETCYLL
jgi:hypothetical protein